MKGTFQALAPTSFTLLLAACGSGDVRMTPMQSAFDMQAAVANMVAHGLSTNVSLDGSLIANGTSRTFTGSGTLVLSPAVNATFNGNNALMQRQSISGTVSAGGQGSPYSASVKTYYTPSNSAYLGEVDNVEYDVASTPFEYPTSVVSGSAGVLGTVIRYTDDTMSVSLGTAQVSYSALTPPDGGTSIQITITTKIYDTVSNLTETDATTYDMNASNLLSFRSASVQNQSGTLTVTAQ